MKHFAYILAVGLGSLGTIAVAQSDTDVDLATTTCADFLAMSAEDQRSALDTLNSADAAATADDTDTSADASGDTDTSSADDAASDSAETDGSMDADSDTSADADASASEDPEVQAVITACEADDTALLADQVTSN